MIVPFTSSESVQDLLDLIPPSIFQQIIEYQLNESPELDWEPKHIKAAAELCNYVEMIYEPSNNRSTLVRAANKLRKHLSLDSDG